MLRVINPSTATGGLWRTQQLETQKYKGDCCDRVFFKIVFPPTAGNDIKYVRGNDQSAIFLRV
jgi:hypothetical protein